jgi:hypothetical protein
MDLRGKKRSHRSRKTAYMPRISWLRAQRGKEIQDGSMAEGNEAKRGGEGASKRRIARLHAPDNLSTSPTFSHTPSPSSSSSHSLAVEKDPLLLQPHCLEHQCAHVGRVLALASLPRSDLLLDVCLETNRMAAMLRVSE